MGLISLDLQEETLRSLAEDEALNRTDAERMAEESPEGAKKIFTQAKVNEIVRERIRRERAKTAPTPEEAQMQKLVDMELRVNKEIWLKGNDYPVEDVMEFFDNIDLGRMEAFKKTVWDLENVGVRIRDYQERLRQQKEKKDIVGEVFNASLHLCTTTTEAATP